MIEVKIKYMLSATCGTTMDKVLNLAIDKLLHHKADIVEFEFNDYKYKITKEKIDKW